MRAFAYYYHTLRHCPAPGDPAFETLEILPLRTAFTDAEAALNPEFVTTRRIFEQIINDLETAIDLLPNQFVQGLHHPSYQHGRADKFTAHALMARVLFRLGDKDNALVHLNKVIDENGGRFTLDQDPIEAFNRSDASRGNEVIWYGLFYDVEKGSSPNDATLFTFLDYRALNGGLGANFRRSTWHTYSMTNTSAIEMGWMDAQFRETEKAQRDKRYQQLYHRLEGHRGNLLDNPEIYEQQYTNVREPRIWGNKYFRAPNGQFSNVPVIRLAEMYHTRATIRFEKGELQAAADDLNMIRRRAWDAQVAGVDYDESEEFLTSENITANILHMERLKEFAFEGDWLFYRQALKLPLNPGERQNANPIAFPHTNLFWPLPKAETDFRLN